MRRHSTGPGGQLRADRPPVRQPPGRQAGGAGPGPGGPGLQRGLLEAEGVEVSPGEQVDLERFGWRPTAEERKRFAALFQPSQDQL